MLKQFYAVTAWSYPYSLGVYRVSLQGTNVQILKVFAKGNSDIQVGDELDHGNTLSVTYHKGLLRYNPYNYLRSDQLNPVHRGDHTSPIVGIFKTKTRALQCYKTKNLQYWDPRFLQDSIWALTQIATNEHPIVKLDSVLWRGFKADMLPQFLTGM